MKKINNLIKKIKKSRSKTVMLESIDDFVSMTKEENEMLRLQMMAREKERDEYKKELEDIHRSISYRVGRWIAETRIGGRFKKILRKYIWK
jgi:hypothetical protein